MQRCSSMRLSRARSTRPYGRASCLFRQPPFMVITKHTEKSRQQAMHAFYPRTQQYRQCAEGCEGQAEGMRVLAAVLPAVQEDLCALPHMVHAVTQAHGLELVHPHACIGAARVGARVFFVNGTVCRRSMHACTPTRGNTSMVCICMACCRGICGSRTVVVGPGSLGVRVYDADPEACKVAHAPEHGLQQHACLRSWACPLQRTSTCL